jgi:hypothetical protein
LYQQERSIQYPEKDHQYPEEQYPIPKRSNIQIQKIRTDQFLKRNQYPTHPFEKPRYPIARFEKPLSPGKSLHAALNQRSKRFFYARHFIQSWFSEE